MADRTTLDECPDAAGSFNGPNGGGLPPIPNPGPGPYVPPQFCVGTWRLNQDECVAAANRYQEQIAAQALAISGAPLNVFKLLGIHEQGRLVDLTGQGQALGEGQPGNAFDSLAGEWTSPATGLDVAGQAHIGYDFGVRKTSYGQDANAPGQPASQHITSLRITQGSDPATRALQVRVDRSDGAFAIRQRCLPGDCTRKEDDIIFTPGAQKGRIADFRAGERSQQGSFMLAASSPTQFTAAFLTGSTTEILGVATVGQRFVSELGSFTIVPGPVPFAPGDAFTVPIDMEWLRVDVVNLPSTASPTLVRIKQSAASRYWRLVPTSFAGATTGAAWVVDKLELMDYQSTTIDDVQDLLYMENRDRDYARSSVQLRVSYQPFDAVTDMSKFGFQVADIYSFTVSFAEMVRALGRPVIVGDVLELPPEVQYDQHLRPVRKFLEVTDTGWAADGYTPGWVPIIFRFQAQQLIPSQEHRDILGTVDTQKYVIDDGRFFDGIEQIQTQPLTATEHIAAEARQAAPEKGASIVEMASGTNRFGRPGSYDGVGVYVEDGIPPDGQPYGQGLKLPDIGTASDGQWFRLTYPPELNHAARLYKFSSMKNAWVFMEKDRRGERTSHKPSHLEVLNLDDTMPLSTKKV